MALLVVLLIAVAGVALARRVSSGYAPAPEGLAVLHAGEAAFVDAVGEVLFPARGAMALAGREAWLPHSIDRHLAALPGDKRFQIRLLFGAAEHGTLLFPGSEPGGRRRFSSLSAASRVDLLERWSQHRFGVLRLLFTALRSVFVLAYLGHPANLQGLGLAPFAIEPGITDAELLFPRVGALRASNTFTPDDRTPASARTPLDPTGPRHPAYERVARGGGRSR